MEFWVLPQHCTNWEWGSMPILPTLGKWRFKVSLGYVRRCLFKKKKKKKRKPMILKDEKYFANQKAKVDREVVVQAGFNPSTPGTEAGR